MNDIPIQSAHWLGVTLYSIGDAVIATDTATQITFMNPVAESLTGWQMDEALGRDLAEVFKIINESSRQKVESPVGRALREGVVVGLANHTLLISKDGVERPIDDSAAPIRDESGQVAGVVLVFRDISERKQYEQRLIETLEYATNILETLRESLVVLNDDLKIVSANGAFYRTFQITQEEAVGSFLYELGHRQWDIPQLRAMLDDISTHNRSFDDFEVELNDSGAGHRIMLLNGRRIRKPGNHSELILLAFEDATDRIRTERLLIVSEKRYRRLFESARDGILILDRSTLRIIDSNPYMTELLGYSAEQFLGKELWEIGLFQDKSKSQAAMRRLQEEGYVRYEDLSLESNQGVTRDVEFVCNVYQEDGYEVAQCNIRDITQRKQLERQKLQSLQLADENRRKDEFLAMLSHELRNPMAPIFNALQIIGQEGGESELQREARGVIERQVRHLSQTLSVTLADGVVWLEGDATRLEQVIGNLLINSSKYNNPGGRIELTVTRLSHHVTIAVRDDGMGISPELLPHIFDLFTQADKSLHRSEGGLGIGLALVKSLIELHRGTVEVKSEGIGKGSEFVVRLPIAVDSSIPREAIPVQPARAARPLRILVVDDNVDAATISSLMLRSWGHEVRVAFNGSEALHRIIGFQPDLVLLDIGLPEMDGYEVARHIRHTASTDKIRLVAVTGYGQESDRERARDAGFDAYLVKPVDPVQLKEILNGMDPSTS